MRRSALMDQTKGWSNLKAELGLGRSVCKWGSRARSKRQGHRGLEGQAWNDSMGF